MSREYGADGVHAFDGAAFVIAAGKTVAHAIAQGLPFALRNARSDAAIGDDLDGTPGEQHIDQHAAVVLGVPHAQMREHLLRALARRARKIAPRQRAFDRKADLALVLPFAA